MNFTRYLSLSQRFSQRKWRGILPILLAITMVTFHGSFNFQGRPYGPGPITQTPSPTSWNPNVACTPIAVGLSDVLGSAYPSQSLAGSRWQVNATGGGISDKRALSPPCTVTNTSGQTVSSFVEIDNVRLSNYLYETRDCSNSFDPVNNAGAPYPNNWTVCDSTGDIQDANSTDSAFIHVEMDRDWMVQGYCGLSTVYCNNSTIVNGQSCTVQYPCSEAVLLNVQGFLFWDPEGHWELHPLTGWKTTAVLTTVVFASFTFNPTSPTRGESITFSGNVSGGTAPYTFSWSFGDGTNLSGSVAVHSYASVGSFAVNLTVSDANGITDSTSMNLKVGSGTTSSFSTTVLFLILVIGVGLSLVGVLGVSNRRASARLQSAKKHNSGLN